jgi:BCD family chlorophyll transporter-like MFS transporter
VRGVEGPATEPAKAVAAAVAAGRPPAAERRPGFGEALGQVWAERKARRFAVFVFVSMLAYSAQDLILEPFAGAVFGLTLGESTKLSGVQNGGVFVGMLLVALAVSGGRLGSLTAWTVGGCLASAAALASLALASAVGPAFPLRTAVFLLGLSNGAFAVAAIGSMMGLAGAGREGREGTRMGLWGAAQALAFGLGGFAGTLASDLAHVALGAPAPAYAAVFAGEATLFLAAAWLAMRVAAPAASRRSLPFDEARGGYALSLGARREDRRAHPEPHPEEPAKRASRRRVPQTALVVEPFETALRASSG